MVNSLDRGSEESEWEPEPFHLPLVDVPLRAPPTITLDEPPEPGERGRVIVIDLA